jgi:hypothetical protein
VFRFVGRNIIEQKRPKDIEPTRQSLEKIMWRIKPYIPVTPKVEHKESGRGQLLVWPD